MRKWSSLWGRLKNTPGIARDLTIVVCLLVMGGAATVWFVGNYHLDGPTSDRFEFSAEFDQAPAVQLAAKQEVRVAGIPVGRIVDAGVTDNGNAELTFEIDHQATVYENARLVMRSKTPLNAMYVTLDPGGPPAKPLAEGGVIPISQTQRVLQPYELLDQLDGRARQALTDLVTQADVALANAPKELPPGMTAIEGAAKSFEPVIKALELRRKNIAHLVTSVAEISAAAGQDDDRLAHLADSLSTTVRVIAQHDDDLRQSLTELPGVTRTLRTAMERTARLSTLLSPTLVQLHKAADQLPGVLHDLGDTVVNARGLLEAARPVVRKLRPVVADLRPLVADLHGALGDLSPVVSTLPGATAKIVPWLDNLGAFIYQTSSSFSLGDVNGGIGRADVVLKLTDPTGGGLQ